MIDVNNNKEPHQLETSDPGRGLHFDAKPEGVSESAPDHRFDQRLQKTKPRTKRRTLLTQNVLRAV